MPASKIVVDRDEFIAFAKGILLDFKNGTGLIVDEQSCSRAYDALENGEEIYLAENGRIVSKVVPGKDNFIEDEI